MKFANSKILAKVNAKIFSNSKAVTNSKENANSKAVANSKIADTPPPPLRSMNGALLSKLSLLQQYSH